MTNENTTNNEQLRVTEYVRGFQAADTNAVRLVAELEAKIASIQQRNEELMARCLQRRDVIQELQEMRTELRARIAKMVEVATKAARLGFIDVKTKALNQIITIGEGNGA